MAEKNTPQHDAESLRMIAGWLDKDGLRDPAGFLRRVADDIERRATDGQRAGVPEGYVLMPVELTPEMIKAGANSGGLGMNFLEWMGRLSIAWRHMLAAAPTPPAGDAGQEPTEAMIDAARPLFLALEAGATTIEAVRELVSRGGRTEISHLPEWFRTGSGHLAKAGRAILAWHMMQNAAIEASKGERG